MKKKNFVKNWRGRLKRVYRYLRMCIYILVAKYVHSVFSLSFFSFSAFLPSIIIRLFFFFLFFLKRLPQFDTNAYIRLNGHLCYLSGCRPRMAVSRIVCSSRLTALLCVVCCSVCEVKTLLVLSRVHS